MRSYGRGTCPCPRSFGRTDPALPDQNPHEIRRLHLGELDVRPSRKMRVDRQRPGNRVQSRLGWFAQNNALRVAHPQRDRVDALTSRRRATLD